MQPACVLGAERVRIAQRVEPRPPERLVGVDVAHAGQEVLVHQQRLEPAAAPGERLGEPPRGEVARERLRAAGQHAGGLAFHRQPRGQVAAIQPHPPELTHIAEAQLPAVGKGQHNVNVAILWSARLHYEELARHLEVNRQHGRIRARAVAVGIARRPEPHEQLFAAPAHTHDLAAHERPRESLRVVAAQRTRPVGARADDPRAYHEAAQIPGDRFDFRQFGH